MPRPERPLDPDSGPVQRFAFELRKLRTEAGSPGYRELARRAHYSITTLAQAARGESLPSLAVTLAYVQACGGNATDWEERWHATAAELGHPSPSAPVDDGRAPYVGTAAYGQADAEWFHGRRRLLATLTERLARQRFVTVVGASGAGKSSLLRAGLVPALSGGPATTLVLTPGTHPLEECAVRLGARLGVAPGELAADLAERPRNLGLAIRQLLADSEPDAELVLIVDQFEEIFTRCADETERDRFVAALREAAEDPDSRTRVVVGLRADFAARLAGWWGAMVVVEPMTAEELAEAVTRPAAHAGLIVEKSLVATVVSEAVNRQGALPFVSQAMWENWRRRRGNGLFLAEYRAAGGMRGAITRAADEVDGELDDGQRRIARDILARLTTLGEHAGRDTPRRVARAELGTSPPATQVLDRLVAARLVTLAEDTVEIAHEALLTWPTLRKWLAANRKTLRVHRRLTEAAAEWERQGRDEGYLYRGSVLDVWKTDAPDTLNEAESAFLAASTAVQRRERSARRRRLGLTVAGLGVIGVVLSVLTYLLVVARPDMPAEERDLAYSRQLAAAARSQLPVDPELALLLAIEATEVRRTPESDAVLRQAVVDSRVVASLPTGIGRALGVAYSPKGVSRIAVTGDDGTVRLWDEPARGKPWGKPMVLHGHTGEVWSPVFSPDGRYLATAGADATVRLWDLSSGRVATLRGHSGLILNLAFSGDGTRLASTGEDGVVVWDVAGLRELARFAGQAFGVAFSPDSRYLAYSAWDGLVWLRDLAGERAPVSFPGPPSWQGRVVFSPDGRRLVSSSDDGMLRIWDTAGEAAPVTLRGHDGRVLALAFSSDGRTLATTGQDGTVRLLTTEKDVNPMILRGHRGEVWGVAFNPDGTRLASVGIDGMLRVWRVSAPGDGVVLRGHDGPVLSADFVPDGSRVVSASQDGTVRVWPLPGGEPVTVLSHGGPVLDVDVSPDSRQAASVSGDGVLRVWDLETGELVREETGAEWSVEFTPDGRQIITGCADGSVCRMPGGSPLPGYQGGIRQVAANGSLVAGSGDDGSVLVWRAGNWPVVLRGHSGPVYSVAIDPLGRKVASGGYDGTVRIWPVVGGAPLELRGHQGLVLSVGFSPDGRLLASSGNDRTLRIWSTTEEGDPVVFSGYQASVDSVSFSADGQSLLTTHDDGTVRVQACEVCGPTQQVLALGRARVTRQLTADERKTFGVRS